MSKIFYPVVAALAALFAAWLYLRMQVWQNPDFFPAEASYIYLRDSSMYLGYLRAAGILLWAFGAWRLWETGKSGIIWTAVLFYSGFLMLDGVLLVPKFLAYQVANETWEEAFPMALFRTIPEALIYVPFNLFLVWLLKNSRQRRLAMHIGL